MNRTLKLVTAVLVLSIMSLSCGDESENTYDRDLELIENATLQPLQLIPQYGSHPVAPLSAELRQRIKATGKVGAEVLNTLETDTYVRVIVSFHVTEGVAEHDGYLFNTNAKRMALRKCADAILQYDSQDKQSGFLVRTRTTTKRLQSNHIHIIRRYDSVNAFAAYIDREALIRLTKDSQVLRIDVDAISKPELLEARAVSRIDDVHVLGYLGSSVTVAVLDSGINHPEINGRVVEEHCFCSGLPFVGCCPDGSEEQHGSGSAIDDHGHGTSVAGVVGWSLAGGAPNVNLVAMRVASGTVRGYTSDAIAALEWLFINKPANLRVVNISLGWLRNLIFTFDGDCDGETSYTTGFATAINNLRNEKGVLVFAASGNEDSSSGMTAPACVHNAVSVGATYDSSIVQICFPDSGCCDNNTSIHQLTCYSNSSLTTDIVAPGSRITTTALGGGMTTANGTSFSSPLVSACAALLFDAMPAATASQVETALKSSGGYCDTDGDCAGSLVCENNKCVVNDPDLPGRSFPILDCLASYEYLCGSCSVRECGTNQCGLACPPGCGAGETCNTSTGQCFTPAPWCGDGNCDSGSGEDCATCALDCGSCAPFCGDGVCNGGETCSSCGNDCRCGVDCTCTATNIGYIKIKRYLCGIGGSFFMLYDDYENGEYDVWYGEYEAGKGAYLDNTPTEGSDSIAIKMKRDGGGSSWTCQLTNNNGYTPGQQTLPDSVTTCEWIVPLSNVEGTYTARIDGNSEQFYMQFFNCGNCPSICVGKCGSIPPCDCGSCPCGYTCDGTLCTGGPCEGKQCGPEPCGGDCGPCAPDETCVANTCQCFDVCSSGSRECTSPSHYRQCGNYDADSCLEWSAVLSCGSGQECSGAGICFDCGGSGESCCSGNTCGAGLTCAGGVCVCMDGCTPSGDRRCVGLMTYQTCGNYDADGCLEWSPDSNCNSGTICSSGSCISCSADGEPCCAGGVCDAGLTCSSGVCTSSGPVCGDSTCDTGEDCNNCPSDCVCGDALICNGVDYCNPASGCETATPPGDGAPCDEGAGQDNNWCNSSCQSGVCNGSISATCDDGLVCNGIETCSATSGCVAGPAAIDGTPCGTKDCDYLDTQCRNYTDVTRFCSGGICQDPICSTYTNSTAGTSCTGCGSASCECNGSGVCVAVGIACVSDVSCDDGNICTTDICWDPGTSSSYCDNVNNTISCGMKDCDYLDTQCRNYNDVTRYCSGGVCQNPSCSSYTNISSGTPCTGCGEANCACDGSGQCVGVCPCSSGTCCDGCNYRPTSYKCQDNVTTWYYCPDGTGCGDDVYVHHQDRYCSGSSSTCNGNLVWDTEAVYDNCSTNEKCTPGDFTCNYDACCSETCGNGNCNASCGETASTCPEDCGVCSCTDSDGDGHYPETCTDQNCSPRDDCDDSRSIVHPGANEECDGWDNDCDGQTDEGCCDCPDYDGDGHYPTWCTDTGCSPRDDCDDDPAGCGANCYPGRTETCNDGYDNNCNGQTDEGCDVCGDGSCTGTENYQNCCQDCECPAGSICQNGNCEPVQPCGDGICSVNENCGLCPIDCECARGWICEGQICVKGGDDGSCGCSSSSGSALNFTMLLGMALGLFLFTRRSRKSA